MSLGLEVVEEHHWKEGTLRMGGTVGEGKEREGVPLTHSYTSPFPLGPASGSWPGLQKHCPEPIQVVTTPFPCLWTQSREKLGTALEMILSETVNSLLLWKTRLLKK